MDSALGVMLLILCVGAGTLLLRASCMIFFGNESIPPGLARPLRFVPAAVLPALVVPSLLCPSGSLDLSAGNARLLAGVIAGIVAFRTKSILLTLVVGMGTLWIVDGWL